MRTFAAVAVSGALGLLLIKMLFPLFAMLFGLMALAFKVLPSDSSRTSSIRWFAGRREKGTSPRPSEARRGRDRLAAVPAPRPSRT
jgi:hypothetical protein